MNYLYTSIAFFVGFMLPVQVGINAELARFINSPVLAALISFVVGSVCFGVGMGGRDYWCSSGFRLYHCGAKNWSTCFGWNTACGSINRFGFDRSLWMAGFSHTKNECRSAGWCPIAGWRVSFNSQKLKR